CAWWRAQEGLDRPSHRTQLGQLHPSEPSAGNRGAREPSRRRFRVASTVRITIMKLSRFVALVLLSSLVAPVAAQGLWLGPHPRPMPPETRPEVRPLPVSIAAIRVTELRIHTDIDEGVATTELRQVFRNDGGRAGEGIWILPLPPGAVVDKFAMTANGVTMPA